VAQGLAVEAARAGKIVILADLDARQATSARWAERRNAAGQKPPIDVRLTSQRQVWELSALCHRLVIDTPGYADVATLELATRSDLLLLTTGTNLIELEPTVGLMRELMQHGVPKAKVAIALVKVIDADREKEARAYLKAAELEVLEASLGWFKSIHDIAADGRGVTESPNRAVAAHGAVFFGGVMEAVMRAAHPEREAAQKAAVAQAKGARQRGGRERG
jgi:hypothetical protein